MKCVYIEGFLHVLSWVLFIESKQSNTLQIQNAMPIPLSKQIKFIILIVIITEQANMITVKCQVFD